MIYNDIEKIQTEINKKKEYLTVHSVMLIMLTVMCRYELGLAAF